MCLSTNIVHWHNPDDRNMTAGRIESAGMNWGGHTLYEIF
jgi:hypothetical protein